MDGGQTSGPAVVALGGGHGLAATLRAAKCYAGTLSGVVSVGDDGGSSGRLRQDLGVAPPGDLRRCLSALAADDSLLARALEYRFEEGGLRGHPIGNLLVTALSLAGDDLQAAVDEVARLIGAAGRVFPATSVPVTLIADSDAGTLAGQVTIERASGIRNLRFDPVDPPGSPEAAEAVVQADQVILGPGSLFTSVLATAVVPAVRASLAATTAQRVFIANITNEKGEARGFGLREHLATLADHGITIDVVLAAPEAVETVDTVAEPIPIVVKPLGSGDGWSHDPALLGPALAELVSEVRTTG